MTTFETFRQISAQCYREFPIKFIVKISGRRHWLSSQNLTLIVIAFSNILLRSRALLASSKLLVVGFRHIELSCEQPAFSPRPARERAPTFGGGLLNKKKTTECEGV